MRTSFLILASLLVTGATAQHRAYEAPRNVLSERQARKKAFTILKGDPYGTTPAQVARNIVSVTFSQNAEKECGSPTPPAWVIQVRVPKYRLPAHQDRSQDLAGPFAIYASTGALLCSRLPYLD